MRSENFAMVGRMDGTPPSSEGGRSHEHAARSRRHQLRRINSEPADPQLPRQLRHPQSRRTVEEARSRRLQAQDHFAVQGRTEDAQPLRPDREGQGDPRQGVPRPRSRDRRRDVRHLLPARSRRGSGEHPGGVSRPGRHRLRRCPTGRRRQRVSRLRRLERRPAGVCNSSQFR